MSKGRREHRQLGGGGSVGGHLPPLLHVRLIAGNMFPERGKHRRHRLPQQPVPILERLIQHGHGLHATGGFCSCSPALHSSAAAVRPWTGRAWEARLRSCPEAAPLVSRGSDAGVLRLER